MNQTMIPIRAFALLPVCADTDIPGLCPTPILLVDTENVVSYLGVNLLAFGFIADERGLEQGRIRSV